MKAEDIFLIRFNFQKLLRQGIADNDIGRISNALSLAAERVGETLESFRATNMAAAGRIAETYDTSRLDGLRAKVVFIGDSITSDRLSYMNIIREALSGFAEIKLVDASLSAWRSGDAIQDFFASVAIHEPDIAVVMLGSNDMRSFTVPGLPSVTSLNEYGRNISVILNMLRITGTHSVIVNTLPPVDRERLHKAYGQPKWDFTAENNTKYNETLKAEAKLSGAIINDVTEAFKACCGTGWQNDALDGDGVHLSPAGQSAIAGRLFPLLAAEIIKINANGK